MAGHDRWNAVESIGSHNEPDLEAARSATGNPAGAVRVQVSVTMDARVYLTDCSRRGIELRRHGDTLTLGLDFWHFAQALEPEARTRAFDTWRAERGAMPPNVCIILRIPLKDFEPLREHLKTILGSDIFARVCNAAVGVPTSSCCSQCGRPF